MSIMSPWDAPPPDAPNRREWELALGVELNALLGASRALTERSAAVFHPDLQPAAFHLARWLYAYGPAKPSEVASAVAMDRSSTSQLLKKMKTLGLVDRAPDPHDGRGVVVSLTSEGAERVNEALDLRGSTFFHRTASWSETELRTFVELLRVFNSTSA